MASQDNTASALACRELILLARRGGKARLRDDAAAPGDAAQGAGGRRRDVTGASSARGTRPRPASANAARGTAASSSRRPGSSGPNRDVHAPRLPQRSAAAPHRPKSSTGQRPRKERAEDPLLPFREKLSEVLERKESLDYCERPFFRTALWEASWKNNEDIVRLLVDKRACVHKEDYQKRTPLHEAAYYGHKNLVDFLIDQGHPVNCVDKFGQTPLFRAVEAGRRGVVELLVHRGATVALLDQDNVTASHLAAFRGLPQLSEWLLYKGAFRNRFEITERTYESRQVATPRSVSSALDARIPNASMGDGGELRPALPPNLGPSAPRSADEFGFARGRTGNQFLKDLTMKVH